MARLSPRAARGRLGLALWWVALAALLVAVSTWVAGEVAERHERETADMRVAAALRSASSQFERAVADTEARAERLARSEEVQRAIATRDRAAAERLAGENDIALFAGEALLAGRNDWPARREVAVVGRDGRTLGQVVAGLDLDGALLERLRRDSGLTQDDLLAVADGTDVLAATGPLDAGAALPARPSGQTDAGGEAYRFASAPLLSGTDVRLGALTSAEPIEAATADTRRRAFVAALATVLLAGLAFAALRRLLRDREIQHAEPAAVDGQRRRARDARHDRHGARRVRDAVALVGEALAATHDPEALLPVILQSAIGATGAVGARLVSDGNEVARAGDPERGGRALALRLGSDDDGIGQLLLYPAADATFDAEAEQLAHWLAAQASIALENERLHRTVKSQAITDELTQLANRRRFTETLGLEVRRAERFGDPLALVLADLDDFKRINDRYGHQTGDEVLRRFADVMRESVRDFDLPVRFGGEEFAVLLPETTLEGGEQLARRLAEAVARLRIPPIEGDPAPFTASFGVAAYPAARTAEELLSAADRALYEAKAAGKNRVVCASPEPGRTA